MTRTLDAAASQLLVYTAPWAPDANFTRGGPDWTAQAHLRASHPTRTSGSTPSTCRLWSRYDPADAGPLHRAIPGEAHTTRLPCGNRDGSVLVPFNMAPWDFVKVTHGGTTVFLGLFCGTRWNPRASRVEAVCRDFRVLLRRRKNRGSYWWNPEAAETPFIQDYGPHFNADGRPDQNTDADGTRRSSFLVPGYNTDKDGQVDASVVFASFWRPGDALNALRAMWATEDVPVEDGTERPILDRLDEFIDWPEASPEGNWPWLFTDPDTGYERRVVDLDCRGRDLGWSIDQIVASAGAYDWTLLYDGNRARIHIYPVFAGLDDAVNDLVLGTVGGKYQDNPPDVTDAGLEMDWTDAYAKVRVVGARKRFDITLTTEDNSLVPLWTSGVGGDQSAWLALSETDKDKASQAYPDVFLAFGASESLDWNNYSLGKYQEGTRPVLGQLISEALDLQEAADRPVKLGIRVWRQKTMGGAWEPLPGSIGVTPLPLADGRVGIRLATSARQTLIRSVGAAAEPWTWDGNTGSPGLYDFRVTLCVEADERLFIVRDNASLKWPAGELYVSAGERYQWHLRRKCILRASEPTPGTYVPVVNGGTDHEFGSSAVDTVRDDTEEITALAQRRLDQVARPRLRGSLELIGLRPEITPGYLVGTVTGGGGHPSMDIYSAVRTVELDEVRDRTLLSFEGV